MERHVGLALSVALGLWLTLGAAGSVGAQADAPLPIEETSSEELREAADDRRTGLVSDVAVLVVMPFQVHSQRPIQHLSESLSTLLAARLQGTGKVAVVDQRQVEAAMPPGPSAELSDSQLRALAGELGASGVVTGSLTELAGRYSLDVRMTPATGGLRSHTLVYTAESNQELIDKLGELTEQVVAVLSGADPGRIVGVQIVGAADLEPFFREAITSQAGTSYDPNRSQADRAMMEEHERVAKVSVDTERRAGGVLLTFTVVRSEMIIGQGGLASSGEEVRQIDIRGNRRIESDAIRQRIQTRVGDPLNRGTLATDLREIHSLGFFRNVYVFVEEGEGGLVLIFEVEENPVIRQIAIIGNDNLDSDKIKDVLTLTTGSTLDHPLLHENTERITQLYRQQGYYLAEVAFSVDEAGEGAVSVEFDVQENGKQRLKNIEFIGNEAFSSRNLKENFSTKTWKFYSFASSWFDHTGTYSEPIFARDLREIEKKYTDSGYLQVQVGEPEVDATEEGLFVRVKLVEGPLFTVGNIDVVGDETMDLEALREKLKLEAGDVFNRSFLTQDVESLERHYTDRGFFLAGVQPGTRVNQEDRTVDVQFGVEKGPLYFVRKINISGNTRTIDPVIRREMKVVEGQLYSARGIQLSTQRIRRLGFFEDVAFESQPTPDPSQLDLNVNVVERPTGSFSFGAGFSSQDGLVFTASLAQSNLFGRGYFVNMTVDVGGTTNRYFVSLSDPYFLGTTYSLAGTIFVTDVNFDTFQSKQRGFSFSLGHSLSENNDARGSLHYAWSSRRVTQNTNINASAPIFREVLQGNESSSILGVTLTRDTRDDRFTATSGTNAALTVEYAGLGGFANFFRVEGRGAWYLGAPSWMLDRSTFVLSTRIGYALPLNQISDWDLLIDDTTLCSDPSRCVNVARLDQIDTDIRLPLTERYFLGGIGPFQLRGYRARTVGPRRPILQRQTIPGEGTLFFPVGTDLELDPVNQRLEAVCRDTFPTQGNGNGRCNSLGDQDFDDFNDIIETDVIGGSSFISSSFEYRFPISEQVGLQGVVFVDGGNSFYEGQNLFDASMWRYGYGGGVLWFSPFGPLQLVLGFPINPRGFEESPVFEFSVGGFGL